MYIVFGAAALIGLVVLAGISRFNPTDGGNDIPSANASDVMNMPFTVGGETFVLKDGKAEKEYAPGSASKNTLFIFGEPVYGDLDEDGDMDAAVMLANDPGGSGTFFYAVLAMNGENGYRATNAMLLGDRIAPQTVEIQDGRAVYNYAERRADEPMSTRPSMGRSTWIAYNKNTNEIGEWVKDFEGETDTVLSEAQARVIAERLCIKGGEALEPGTHNANTRTWWFDANLNTTRPGCDPACVVSEDKGTAEINWRCTGAIGPNDSGVRGKVLLGPTCPVMRVPPDPQCADKPYETMVAVIVVGSPSGAPYAVVKSGADGTYSIALPPGTYALQPRGRQPFPMCGTKDVTVTAGNVLEANLSCDTGIR
ncbi:MAG: hypothetical protein RL681_230 [Candidatus Parcubacteria bacterium]